jgi:hypothetical protein
MRLLFPILLAGLLSAGTSQALTVRTNAVPNGFGGPTEIREFEPRDPDQFEKGVSRRIVFFGPGHTNRIIEETYARWKIDRDGDWRTVFFFSPSGVLLRSETWRSNEEVLRAGWDLRTTFFNASGYAESSDFRYIPERSKREHLLLLREHYDPEGRITRMVRYFTPDYTIHTGDIREIRTFDKQGLAELLTVASNRSLSKKGILLMTDSRRPDPPIAGELIWREFLYSDARAASTGFRSVRRYFGPNGRPDRDEIGFSPGFEEMNGVVRGVLSYDGFGQPVKLTCLDRRHKTVKEVFGAPDISKYLGHQFPTPP